MKYLQIKYLDKILAFLIILAAIIDFSNVDNYIYSKLCILIGYLYTPPNCFIGYYDLPIWELIAAIGLIITVYVAIRPISEKALLGKAIFEDAIQVIIEADGVFRIVNIYDEPVIIKSINQYLLEGKKDLSLSDGPEPHQISKKITKIPVKDFSEKLNREKRLAYKIPVAFGNSLTHLPRGYETEPVWVVVTKIKYESTDGLSKETEYKHRFSVILEPRNRWIEIL